jgi:riboflavin kinase / FMN hydrolase
MYKINISQSKIFDIPHSMYASAHKLPEPIRCKGPVVHGFKRGSKELGIPTANLDVESLCAEIHSAPTGVYFGWASVGTSPDVYKFVMSMGFNPYYQNTKKTVEPHLLHSFDDDFYGQELRLTICGYLREEATFPSLDALISTIHADIAAARTFLDGAEYSSLSHDEFLRTIESAKDSCAESTAAPKLSRIV